MVNHKHTIIATRKLAITQKHPTKIMGQNSQDGDVISRGGL
jgi:hypothetical protein